MFGLVPKALWNRMIQADDRNTIPQNATAILFETPDGTRGIVETGCGDPQDFSDRERSIHGMPDEPWPLEEAFRAKGWSFDDMDVVVLSHLHWDHAGGISRGAERTLTFPNADIYVHQQELDDALSGDVLLHKSYPSDVVEPFQSMDATRLKTVTGTSTEILPGIWMDQVGGHTRGQCVIRFQSDALQVLNEQGEPMDFNAPDVVYMADACPTRHHFRLVFQPAYDVLPLDSRRWKLRALPAFAEQGALVLFDHDPDVYGGTLTQEGPDKFSIDQHLNIS